MNRKTFIQTVSLAGSALLSPAISLANNKMGDNNLKDSTRINFTRDGLDLTTDEYTSLLRMMVEDNGISADSYSQGGIVEQLENRMAEVLGKESAIFMPTGTLANHIAVRKLAGDKKRVIVQADSHLYNDSGDCATKLSGLNLIPLAKGKTSFSTDDIKKELDRAKDGRVKTGIGAILIESPVRRLDNRMFEFDMMKDISMFAKENHIKMHLDGARLFNACVHLSKTPADFASLFDTVYVSLYKNFNAASGAILAGSKEFIQDLYHTRRMFGGGMPQVWPFASVAYHYLDGFLESYTLALEMADRLFMLLNKHSAFKVEQFSDGTNVFKFHVDLQDLNRFRKNLADQNIFLPAPDNSFNGFKIKVNPSLLHTTAEKLSQQFIDATAG